jgi:hypothetical protein
VKNYRLAQIFNSKNLIVKKVSRGKLYAILLIMLLIECIMDAVAIWSDNVKVAYNPADTVQSYAICNTSSIRFIPWAAYKVSIKHHAMSQQKSYHCSKHAFSLQIATSTHDLLTSIRLLETCHYTNNIYIIFYHIISYHIIRPVY